MKKLLLTLLCLPMIGFGQPTVNIPDANFKASLVVNPNINTNGDAEIQVSEATLFNGSLYCSNLNIAELTGIEAFTALTTLVCTNNQITSLDVSQNTALTWLNCEDNQLTNLDVSGATVLTHLYCYNNQLTSLDVSQNTALTVLNCVNNQITSLDLSQNTALTVLNCENNQLTSLDVSQNTALEELNSNLNQLTSLDGSYNTALVFLNCENNQLTSLDVRNGNNTNFWLFLATNNPNLYCINVDDTTWSTANWILIDPWASFSTNCPPSVIQEHTTNKELLKIVDILGRETKGTNQPLFYIYDDGTVEKRIVIE